MAKKPKKDVGKGKSKSNLISRPDFLKTAGVAAAGAGAAAVGLGGVAKATVPPGSDFDSEGSPIGVVKMDPLWTYAGLYTEQGVVQEGVPELLQQYILSGETDDKIWKKIAGKVDFLYDRMDDMFGKPVTDDYGNVTGFTGGLFEGDTEILNKILQTRNDDKKFLFKPNWVTPLHDIDPFGDPEADPPKPPYGRGKSWGGSTAWPFMAALMRWFHDRLGVPFNRMLVGEGGDSSEYDWALLGLPVTALYEGRVPGEYVPKDEDEKPLLPVAPNGYWYGGTGFFWARKYLVEKTGDYSAMNGYEKSYMIDLYSEEWQGYDPTGYVSPSHPEYDGIYLYNTNYLGRPDVDPQYYRGAVLPVPFENPSDPTYNKPWNVGVAEEDLITHVVVHHAFTDPTVGFIVNCPKFKIHPLGNMTLALKNIGLGIPAQWAPKPPDFQEWLYAYPDNFPLNEEYDVGIPCEKWAIPHEMYYGKLDRNGIPYLKSLTEGDPNYDESPYKLYLLNGMVLDVPHYQVHKTGSLGGYIMDATLALESVKPDMLHVVDGVVAANFFHEASESEALKIQLQNEGLLFASSNPVALDKFGLRYMYKKIYLRDIEEIPAGVYPPGLFFNYAFISTFDPKDENNDPIAPGQVYSEILRHPETGEVILDERGLAIPLPSPDPSTAEVGDNRTGSDFYDPEHGLMPFEGWAETAGLGTRHYHVLGRELDVRNKVVAKLGSINGHLVRDRLGKFVKEAPEEVISPTLYYNFTPFSCQCNTASNFLQAMDDLTLAVTSQLPPFHPAHNKVLMIGCHLVWPSDLPPGEQSNNEFRRQLNLIYPDGIMQQDELGGDAFILSMASISVNQARDIVLREIRALTHLGYPLEVAIGIATAKATYFSSLLIRYADPLWNDKGPFGVPGHYTIGIIAANYAMLMAWQLATMPGPDPADFPHVANADWYFYGVTDELTGGANPHLLVYGTYANEIKEVLNPYYLEEPPPGYPVTSPYIKLAWLGEKIVPSASPVEYPPGSDNYVLVAVPPTSPASLPPGTYWPSGHFGRWLTAIAFIFGADYLQNGDTAGSPYWAAGLYSEILHEVDPDPDAVYDWKLYIPEVQYLGIPKTVPLVLGTPEYAAKAYKTEFYKDVGAGNGSYIKTTIPETEIEIFVLVGPGSGDWELVETWPDSYMLEGSTA